MLWFKRNRNKEYQPKFKISREDVIKANEIVMGLRPEPEVPEKYKELYERVKCNFTYNELKDLLETISINDEKYNFSS